LRTVRDIATVEAAWLCAAATLPIGWCLSMPFQSEPDGPWEVVAHNLDGCLFDVPYVMQTDRDRHDAIIDLTIEIDAFQEVGLVSERAHRPNRRRRVVSKGPRMHDSKSTMLLLGWNW
jgi:hypothetical protein